MDQGEGLTGALADTEKSQELLEEMLWRFRVEDGKWKRSVCVCVCTYLLVHVYLFICACSQKKKKNLC